MAKSLRSFVVHLASRVTMTRVEAGVPDQRRGEGLGQGQNFPRNASTSLKRRRARDPLRLLCPRPLAGWLGPLLARVPLGGRRLAFSPSACSLELRLLP